MDNLESHTYEVFEKDPVKYSEYQKAIFYALRDRVPESEAETRVTYVWFASMTKTWKLVYRACRWEPGYPPECVSDELNVKSAVIMMRAQTKMFSSISNRN